MKKASNGNQKKENFKTSDPRNTTVSDRYVVVEGTKVFLTMEQLKAWDRFINSTRNEARRLEACGQPDYHRCYGDCETCSWCQSGKRLQVDSYYFANDFAPDVLSDSWVVISDVDALIDRLRRNSLYRYSRKIAPLGDHLMFYFIEDGLSVSEISRLLKIPRETVRYRLNIILKELRLHADLFF